MQEATYYVQFSSPADDSRRWHTIARVRIVNTDSKPWLVVWFNELYQGPNLHAFEAHHGGVRVFPIGHEHLRKRRWTEVRELRAALAWHAPQALAG